MDRPGALPGFAKLDQLARTPRRAAFVSPWPETAQKRINAV